MKISTPIKLSDFPKWIKALRSGRYRQISGMLVGRTPGIKNKPTYCCLGVILQLNGEVKNNGQKSGIGYHPLANGEKNKDVLFIDSGGLANHEFFRGVMSNHEVAQLAEWNDDTHIDKMGTRVHRCTFKDIADKLQAKYEKKLTQDGWVQ